MQLETIIELVNKGLAYKPLTVEEIVELNEIANSLIQDEHKFNPPEIPMLIEQGRGPQLLEHIIVNIIKYRDKLNLEFATLKARDNMQIIKQYVYGRSNDASMGSCNDQGTEEN